MNITAQHLNEIIPDLLNIAQHAADSHAETGRASSVNVKLKIRKNKEGKHLLEARISAVLPEGNDDSHTRKLETVTLAQWTDEHPGQMRIET